MRASALAAVPKKVSPKPAAVRLNVGQQLVFKKGYVISPANFVRLKRYLQIGDFFIVKAEYRKGDERLDRHADYEHKFRITRNVDSIDYLFSGKLIQIQKVRGYNNPVLTFESEEEHCTHVFDLRIGDADIIFQRMEEPEIINPGAPKQRINDIYLRPYEEGFDGVWQMSA